MNDKKHIGELLQRGQLVWAIQAHQKANGSTLQKAKDECTRLRDKLRVLGHPCERENS